MIELLTAFSISSLILLAVSSLLLQMIKLERKLLVFNQMNNMTETAFVKISDDIRWAESVVLDPPTPEISAEVKKIIITQKNGNEILYEWSKSELKLYRKAELNESLFPDNIQVVAFAAENVADPNKRPLIYVNLELLAMAGGNQRVVLSREMIVSNLNTEVTVRAGAPLQKIVPGFFPTPTPTITPSATPIPPTATPTLSPTPSPVPKCDLANAFGPWNNQPIGRDNNFSGSTNVNGETIYVCGSGTHLQANNSSLSRWDSFHFAYQTISSTNLELTVKLDRWLPHDRKDWQKAGIMLRNSTGDNVPYLAIFRAYNYGIRMYWRRSVNALAEAFGAPNDTLGLDLDKNVWLKLVKQGNLVSGYYSLAEIPVAGEWKELGYAQQINLESNYLYGMIVNSYELGWPATAYFDSVDVSNSISVFPAATPTPKPTATPKPTSTPTPTLIPGPTATPTLLPTPTLIPTSTPTMTPTPTPTPIFIPD